MQRRREQEGPDTGAFFACLVCFLRAAADAGLTWQGVTGCPCRKLNPDLLAMQSVQDWRRQNTADGSRRGGLRQNPYLMIGASGFDCSSLRKIEVMSKMPLAKYDDVVKAFSSDRADQPLTIPFCHGDRGAIERSRMPIA